MAIQTTTKSCSTSNKLLQKVVPLKTEVVPLKTEVVLLKNRSCKPQYKILKKVVRRTTNYYKKLFLLKRKKLFALKQNRLRAKCTTFCLTTNNFFLSVWVFDGKDLLH